MDLFTYYLTVTRYGISLWGTTAFPWCKLLPAPSRKHLLNKWIFKICSCFSNRYDDFFRWIRNSNFSFERKIFVNFLLLDPFCECWPWTEKLKIFWRNIQGPVLTETKRIFSSWKIYIRVLDINIRYNIISDVFIFFFFFYFLQSKKFVFYINYYIILYCVDSSLEKIFQESQKWWRWLFNFKFRNFSRKETIFQHVWNFFLKSLSTQVANFKAHASDKFLDQKLLLIIEFYWARVDYFCLFICPIRYYF